MTLTQRRVGKIACHGRNTGDGSGGDFAHAVASHRSAAWATAKVPLPTLQRPLYPLSEIGSKNGTRFSPTGGEPCVMQSFLSREQDHSTNCS